MSDLLFVVAYKSREIQDLFALEKNKMWPAANYSDTLMVNGASYLYKRLDIPGNCFTCSFVFLSKH